MGEKGRFRVRVVAEEAGADDIFAAAIYGSLIDRLDVGGGPLEELHEGDLSAEDPLGGVGDKELHPLPAGAHEGEGGTEETVGCEAVAQLLGLLRRGELVDIDGQQSGELEERPAVAPAEGAEGRDEGQEPLLGLPQVAGAAYLLGELPQGGIGGDELIDLL